MNAEIENHMVVLDLEPTGPETPEGLELYESLPADYAEDCAADYVHEPFRNGRSFFQELLYLHEVGDGMAMEHVIAELKARCVNHPEAILKWELNRHEDGALIETLRDISKVRL